MKRLSLLACCIIALTGASGNSTIKAFDDAFSKVNDYSVTIREFEAKGDRTQNRTYNLWFKRPTFVKTLITAGDFQGSGAVWNGGDKVSGHRGGFISFIHGKIDVHDWRVTTLRGYTVPDAAIQNQVAKYKEIKGELTQRKGEPIDGVPTDVVELKFADPSTQGGATRAVMYFSSVTHFPLRQIQYEGDKVVGDETFMNLKTNVGLKDSDFPF